jgi:hypothetical protein
MLQFYAFILIRDTGYGILDAGYRMPDAGYRKIEA